MTLLAAFAAVLRRHCGQADLIVGTPISNRALPEFHPLVGSFLNTLALRLDLRGDPTLGEVLDRVRPAVLGAFANQDVPFEQVVQMLNMHRQSAYSSPLEAGFILNQEIPPARFTPDLRATLAELRPPTAKFDLAVYLTETAEGLEATLEYRVGAFHESTAARMFDDFGAALEMLGEAPRRRFPELFPAAEETGRAATAPSPPGSH